MEYLGILIIVQTEYHKANSRALFEMKEVKRKCQLSTDKDVFINNELMKIDYRVSAVGHYYIACNYFWGNTWYGIRNEIARYYLSHGDLFAEPEQGITTDVYRFLFAFCMERELLKMKTAPGPQQENQIVDEAIQSYEKAVSAGLLTKTKTGYKRNGITKAQLAYFLGRIHVPDAAGKDGRVFPETELNTLFGERRLGQTLRELLDNKTGKPRGHGIIDTLFK